MIMTNKIVAVALITALVGASLGAAVMHSRDTAPRAETATTLPDNSAPTWNGTNVRYAAATEQRVPSEFNTSEEQNAYKVGFSDGFQSCGQQRNARVAESGFVPQYGVRNRNTTYRSAYR